MSLDETLVAAARRGNDAKLSAIYDAFEKIGRSPSPMCVASALAAAAANNHVGTVEEILRHANLQHGMLSHSVSMYKAMCSAVSYGSAASIEALVRHKASVDGMFGTRVVNIPFICDAARRFRCDSVRALIRAKAAVSTATSFGRSSPLHKVAEIACGIDYTPATNAMMVRTVRVLLSSKASAKLTDRSGRTPMDIIAKGNGLHLLRPDGFAKSLLAHRFEITLRNHALCRWQRSVRPRPLHGIGERASSSALVVNTRL